MPASAHDCRSMAPRRHFQPRVDGPLNPSDSAGSQTAQNASTGSAARFRPFRPPSPQGCSRLEQPAAARAMAAGARHAKGPLLALMGRGADTQLVFEDCCSGMPEALPCHSQILATWSGVLSHALSAQQPMHWQPMQLDAGSSSSSGGGSSSGCCEAPGRPHVIPMPGTRLDEWLEAAQFMYPVIPPPAVTWDNAETLLLLGGKYDMPALLSLGGRFILDNLCLLDMAEKGGRYVWRWLALADAAGLDDVAAACISRVVQLDRGSCCVEARLQGLSCRALQRLVLRLAAAGGGPATPLAPFTCRFSSGSSPGSSPSTSSRDMSPARWLLDSP